MIARVMDSAARHPRRVLAAFLLLAAASELARRAVPADALPEVSDPQVVVLTAWPERSPALVEARITQPLTARLASVPGARAVRGLSMPGLSFVYVLLDDGADAAGARAQVIERLFQSRTALPPGVAPSLGPDAGSTGWVYQYALVRRRGTTMPAELRRLQERTIRPALEELAGVAEVATLGAAGDEYRVEVDAARLEGHGVTLTDVAETVRGAAGSPVERLLAADGRQYQIRIRADESPMAALMAAPVKRAAGREAPVALGELARIERLTGMAEGAADLDGMLTAVGGIVIARRGEDVPAVISRVKSRLEAVRRALPDGVELVTTYDRGPLIAAAGRTLARALVEEIAIVAAVALLFLQHVRSALLPLITLPVVALVAFVPMYLLGVPATITSLGGIAIALGMAVDAELVMLEACHKQLEAVSPPPAGAERRRLLLDAGRAVTPAMVASLFVAAAAFLPTFAFTGETGRLFRPLALTKTFVILAAAVVSATLAPVLRDLLVRGRVRSERQNPLNRAVVALYRPFVQVALERPLVTVLIGVLAVASALPLVGRLGGEFMPAVDEGDLLFMPSTLPGTSLGEAERQLKVWGRTLRRMPEVRSVLGKVGRAETATDPAPAHMAEILIRLHPRDRWPRPRTVEDLVEQMNRELATVGWTNAWTAPVRARTDMLTTGIRTPVGVRIFAGDPARIDDIGRRLEGILGRVPGTRGVVRDATGGATALEIVPDVAALARHGLARADVERAIAAAHDGWPVAELDEGGAPILVRLALSVGPHGLADPLALERLPVAALPASTSASASASGPPRPVPLALVARVERTPRPVMLRTESGRLAGYVYLDLVESRDVERHVADVEAAIGRARASGELPLEPGESVEVAGAHELVVETKRRLAVILPLCAAAILALLYALFRNVAEVLIVALSLPFSLVGSVWSLYLLDLRLSAPVWVGIISLVGLAAQTGIVMVIYLDQAFLARVRQGRVTTFADIVEAHMEGTVQRVRPKLMTVSTMLFGLSPLLWASGAGAEIMKRVAAPMVGGLVTSAFLTLEVIPVVHTYWRAVQLRRAGRSGRSLAELLRL
jgi:copper/silver efflux system protein